MPKILYSVLEIAQFVSVTFVLATFKKRLPLMIVQAVLISLKVILKFSEGEKKTRNYRLTITYIFFKSIYVILYKSYGVLDISQFGFAVD